MTISDNATGTFPTACGPINQPQTGSFKPQDLLGRTFASSFGGTPASGAWTLIGFDKGGDLDSYSMGPWSLRVTHAPLSLTTTNVKRTKKGVRLTAACNGACTVKSGGQGKAKTFQLGADKPQTLTIPLKGKAVRAGKAKVALTATNDIGDTAKRTVKAKR
jgi:hypothetical protein